MKTYLVKPFYSRDTPSREPAGWDVWEQTETSSVVVVPCDTEEEANTEAEILRGVAAAEVCRG